MLRRLGFVKCSGKFPKPAFVRATSFVCGPWRNLRANSVILSPFKSDKWTFGVQGDYGICLKVRFVLEHIMVLVPLTRMYCYDLVSNVSTFNMHIALSLT